MYKLFAIAHFAHFRTDSFTVTGLSTGQNSPPTICGINTGEHSE